jgi:hypothetical protein
VISLSVKSVSELQVRRGAARDQLVLDVLYSPSGYELLSLRREQARKLAEDSGASGATRGPIWSHRKPTYPVNIRLSGHRPAPGCIELRIAGDRR